MIVGGQRSEKSECGSSPIVPICAVSEGEHLGARFAQVHRGALSPCTTN